MGAAWWVAWPAEALLFLRGGRCSPTCQCAVIIRRQHQLERDSYMRPRVVRRGFNNLSHGNFHKDVLLDFFMTWRLFLFRDMGLG